MAQRATLRAGRHQKQDCKHHIRATLRAGRHQKQDCKHHIRATLRAGRHQKQDCKHHIRATLRAGRHQKQDCKHHIRAQAAVVAQPLQRSQKRVCKHHIRAERRGGYRVPFIIRWLGQVAPGSTSDELVSLIDLSASTLALAGLPTAEVHGLPFLVEEAPAREFVFMARDRIEESVDHVRMVFDGRYRYIRNFLPGQPHFIDRAYYDRTNPVRGLMRQLFADGELTPEQAKVFATRRPDEEFYDLQTDPYELHNLMSSDLIDAPRPEAEAALFRMQAALDEWIVESGDMGAEPEDPDAVDIGGGPGGKKGKGSRGQKTEKGKRETRGSATAAVALPEQADAEPLVLSHMGVFYVGGREVSSAGGGGGSQVNTIEQAPVHYLIPHERRQEAPVVMLPGHGLTSYIYLGTPDGREGWAQTFVRHGCSVYVMDQPNNAVSGFDLRPFEAVRSGQEEPSQMPGVMIWSNESAWRDWGIGPQPGVPFEDTKYPYEYLDQLFASYSAVISAGKGGGGGGCSAGPLQPEAKRRRGGKAAGGKQAKGGAVGNHFGTAAKTRALVDLLQRIGPSVVLVHLATGAVGVEVLRQRPDLVTAVVMVEPLGCPTDPTEVKTLFADKPTIAVFGDHLESRRLQGRYEACLETVQLINEVGGQARMLHLPSLDIYGNTHLLMQDTNNREIARHLLEWLVGLI